GLSQAHPFQSAPQGRPLRGLGAAGGLHQRAPDRLPVAAGLMDSSGAVSPRAARSFSTTHSIERVTMNQQDKVLYTAKVRTTGGPDSGAARSSDGHLDIRLSPPGGHGIGTNPEQLFAAGWSACFESAIGIAARKKKVTLPSDLAIDAEVDLSLVGGF